MSTNGNGKANSKLAAAQQRVTEAEKELRSSESLLAQQKAKLSEAERDVAQLTAKRHELERDVVDDKPGAVARIKQFDATGDVSVASIRVNGLRTKVAFLQQEHDALNVVHQQAAMVLERLVEDERGVALEEQLSVARFHLAQSQEQTKQREKAVNEAYDRFRLWGSQRREAADRETQRISREKFMRDNNQFAVMEKSHTRLRQGF